MSLTLAALAEVAEVQLAGDRGSTFFGVDTLTEAVAGRIASLVNPKYRLQLLPRTRTSAVILREEDRKFCPTNALISQNPYSAFAKGSRKIALHFLGVETPVWQDARSAKDLSGTDLRASPVGVKPTDGLNTSQPI